jgi:DNA repair protein RadA/Sms
LAVIVAILSSYHDIDVSENFCFAAEVGLSGEIRPVPKTEQRIQEASKLGFDTIVISKFAKVSKQNGEIKILAVSKIEALIVALFG